jgi:hypothetical protein
MITTSTKEIISGTEEELLEFFKKKYDLVEREIADVADLLEKAERVQREAEEVVKVSEQSASNQNKPVQVGNKVTKGISNLFGGTSWGK